MRVLIAEDDPTSRKHLAHLVERWGHQPVPAEDGVVALAMLRRPDAPPLALLDWMMPGPDGPEICAALSPSRRYTARHLILLTSNGEPEHVVAGLRAGADDYVAKPFRPDELRVRIDAGIRILGRQQRLIQQVEDLEAAGRERGRPDRFLPICSYCNHIRNQQNRWEGVDVYFHKYAGIDFTHGICPDCFLKIDEASGQRAG